MGKKGWRNTWQYKRIMEILEDYWLDVPDESNVEINMFFLKANGEKQQKTITWENPDIVYAPPFKKWVIEKYLYADDLLGDFARDLLDDKAWPEKDDHEKVLPEDMMETKYRQLYAYLTTQRKSCKEALIVFHKLYRAYMKDVKQKEITRGPLKMVPLSEFHERTDVYRPDWF